MAGYIQLIIGAIIGFSSSVATNWISANWRIKEEKETNKIKLTRQYIDDSLKYVFKINDIMSGIYSNLKTYELAKASYPDRANDFEKKIFVEFEKKQKEGLEAELMFISYKLNNINNDILYNEFTTLTKVQHDVLNCLLNSDEKGYMDVNPIYMSQLRDFVSKCIEICKL
jgi:hypothetical protein